jgi:hypothetical protein
MQTIKLSLLASVTGGAGLGPDPSMSAKGEAISFGATGVNGPAGAGNGGYNLGGGGLTGGGGGVSKRELMDPKSEINRPIY